MDSILSSFRTVFRRQAAFDWFALVVWAFLLRLDGSGLTSVIRLYALAPAEYYSLLHFFHSSAFSAKSLCLRWTEWVLESLPLRRLAGRPLYVIDSLVAAKVGRCMPGVKRLHQGSEVHNRPEFVMGHLWGALSVLAQTGERIFAVPLRLALHDGFKRSPSDKATALTRMGDLILQNALHAGLVLGDCAYVCRHLIDRLVAAGFHFIGRARITTVAYEPAVAPKRPKVGRPRKYGRKRALKELFKDGASFEKATVELYGERQEALLREVTLYWQRRLVKFVLTISTKGTCAIFLCTDLTLTAEQIVEAYGLRFKIEVGFRALAQNLFGFAYRFWMKQMEKTVWKQGSVYLHRAGKTYRARVARKVEAFERFVNLSAMAQGVLQTLALEAAGQVAQQLPVWFRTVRSKVGPSEHLVRATLLGEVGRILGGNGGRALLTRILATRSRDTSARQPMRLTG